MRQYIETFSDYFVIQMAMGLVSALLFSLIFLHATAQDDMGGGEEGGAELLDEASMGMGGEGNKANPGGVVNLSELPELPYIEQTARALQQLAIVIGVIFMVMFLFLLMIGVEKVWDLLEDRYKQKFGKPEPEEDPAALVGTFKRYKN